MGILTDFLHLDLLLGLWCPDLGALRNLLIWLVEIFEKRK